MKKTVFLVLVAVALYGKIYDGVAVVVEDKIITLYDIQKEMRQDRIGVQKATDILIRRKLEEIQLQKRKIGISSAEVYDDIKQMASRNHLSVSEFYDAVREANGLSSSELKEKIKQKLLSQKLYNAIAMRSMSEPTEDEIAEYYALNKEKLQHPESFDVVIYDSKNKSRLEQKIQSPMLYAPDIATNEQTLPYRRISPELASLLEKTPPYHFTPVVPNGKGGFMSFYVKSVKKAHNSSLESIRGEVVNAMMANRRELILRDYFARLRDNSDINIIRLPKE